MPTPYERAKTAWESPDRRGDLNRIVETMAAEGVTQQALEDALESLLLEVRAAGADDDTEEIISGVWDRLTGWCHPSGHIKTAPTTPPTEEEIEILPRWARVAFAARCTRRLLPLLTLAPNASGARQQVAEVVGATERAAVDGRGEQMLEVWGNAARASKAFRDLNLKLQAAVADTAYRAALFAWDEGYMSKPAPGRIYKAVNPTAWNQSHEIANAIGSDITDALRRDYNLLLQAMQEQHWGDDARVSPSFFATPLWPAGIPAGWPDEIERGLDGVDSNNVEDKQEPCST